MSIQKVNDIVQRIYNLPCWSVKQGYGSFLTFEIGQPHLEIIEPTGNGKYLPPKPHSSFRKVYLRGSWHLWIYCCTWELFLREELIAHCESSTQVISDALSFIDGQKINDIKIEPSSGDTVFTFDLGGQLITKGWSDEISEQWMLYEPEGNVLTIRNDGTFHYRPGNSQEEDWRRI